jgi:hypothetical protein
MKILFLDHDGVICLPSEFGGRYKKQKRYCRKNGDVETSKMPVEFRFDSFNQKAVSILNEILAETGAEIVVSSDWRFHCTLIEMQGLYSQRGIIKSPIGYTTESAMDNRCEEIEHWLSEHPQAERWVAVDDLDLSELKSFVRCKKIYEGIKQSGIKEKIIKQIL